MDDLSRADAVVILAKGGVHNPVMDVIDAPASTHRLQQGDSLGGQVGSHECRS